MIEEEHEAKETLNEINKIILIMIKSIYHFFSL